MEQVLACQGYKAPRCQDLPPPLLPPTTKAPEYLHLSPPASIYPTLFFVFTNTLHYYVQNWRTPCSPSRASRRSPKVDSGASSSLEQTIARASGSWIQGESRVHIFCSFILQEFGKVHNTDVTNQIITRRCRTSLGSNEQSEYDARRSSSRKVRTRSHGKPLIM